MVEHLPEDSALIRAVRGHNWTVTDHLLGNVVDGLAGVHHAVYQSQAKQRIPRPEPMKRPDTADAQPAVDRGVSAYIASLMP